MPEHKADPWPFGWIQKIFSSRSRAEELLRPELEGTLTQADYENAVHFFPSNQRYYRTAGALATSAAMSYWGFFRRKPKLSFGRGFLASTLAGFLGASVGLFATLRAHATFINSLEDRDGFMKALGNVNKRLGGGVVGEGQDSNSEEIANQVTSMQNSPESGPANTPSTPDDTSETPPEGASETQQNRWDLIRTANTRNAGRNSSWDALRQNHERQRVQEAGTEEASQYTENDRAQEQARFDAMLEAERRRVDTESGPTLG